MNNGKKQLTSIQINSNNMKRILIDLEKEFDSTIWQRGREYYREGLIGDIIKSGDMVRAKSYGNSTYRLEINLKSGDMKCSCPCDFNCKHLAALIIWLKNNKIPDFSKQANKLNSMTKQELVNVLATILEKQPELSFYMQTPDEDAIKNLIKELWFPRCGDNASLFNKFDFIKKSILKKPEFELIVLFLKKLIDMFDHGPDSNELMDYVDEFLYDISKLNLKKEQKIEIRELIKDYPFDF